MTTRSDLSAYDLLRIAQEQSLTDIASWIESTITADEARIDAERISPFSTPVGSLVIGKRYNVTIRSGRLGSKERTLRSVTLDREHGRWGDPRLAYPSGATATSLSSWTVKQIVKIEEVG